MNNLSNSVLLFTAAAAIAAGDDCAPKGDAPPVATEAGFWELFGFEGLCRPPAANKEEEEGIADIDVELTSLKGVCCCWFWRLAEAAATAASSAEALPDDDAPKGSNAGIGGTAGILGALP